MSTSISSTFDIVTELAAGTGTTNLAAIGRTMRVVGVYGTGLDTGTITVSKVSSGGAATTMGTVTLAAATSNLQDVPGVLASSADRTMLVTDTIRIVRAVANSTRVVIRCEASSPQAITES